MLTDKYINDRGSKEMGNDYFLLMEEALIEARKGLEMGEVPVGAVLAGPDGEIIAKSCNQPIYLKDPTAHAEILTLRKGGEVYNNYRLNDTTLVVTIEPCVMCMGAALNARIARLVFGAFDPKAGAAGSLYDLAGDDRFNHRIEVISGIMEKECKDLLQDFFRIRRIEKER
jgi:tRNA(adenine34) deaminase